MSKTSICDLGETSKIVGENRTILIWRISWKYFFKIILFTSRPWLENVFFLVSKTTHSFSISRLSCLYYQISFVKRQTNISPKSWWVLGTIYAENIMQWNILQTFFYKRILINHSQFHDFIAKRIAIDEHHRPPYVTMEKLTR